MTNEEINLRVQLNQVAKNLTSTDCGRLARYGSMEDKKAYRRLAVILAEQEMAAKKISK